MSENTGIHNNINNNNDNYNEYSFQKSNEDHEQLPVYNIEQNYTPDNISFNINKSSSSSSSDNETNIIPTSLPFKSAKDNNNYNISDKIDYRRSQRSRYSENVGMHANNNNMMSMNNERKCRSAPLLNFQITNEFEYLMKHIMDVDTHIDADDKIDRGNHYRNRNSDNLEVDKEDINYLNQIKNKESNIIKAS